MPEVALFRAENEAGVLGKECGKEGNAQQLQKNKRTQPPDFLPRPMQAICGDQTNSIGDKVGIVPEN